MPKNISTAGGWKYQVRYQAKRFQKHALKKNIKEYEKISFTTGGDFDAAAELHDQG